MFIFCNRRKITYSCDKNSRPFFLSSCGGKHITRVMKSFTNTFYVSIFLVFEISVLIEMNMKCEDFLKSLDNESFQNLCVQRTNKCAIDSFSISQIQKATHPNGFLSLGAIFWRIELNSVSFTKMLYTAHLFNWTSSMLIKSLECVLCHRGFFVLTIGHYYFFSVLLSSKTQLQKDSFYIR